MEEKYASFMTLAYHTILASVRTTSSKEASETYLSVSRLDVLCSHQGRDETPLLAIFVMVSTFSMAHLHPVMNKSSKLYTGEGIRAPPSGNDYQNRQCCVPGTSLFRDAVEDSSGGRSFPSPC